MRLPLGDRYCLDSSFLIHLFEQYAPDIIPPLWESEFARDLESGKCLIPEDVAAEIEFGRTPLWDWIKQYYKTAFVPLTAEHVTVVREILRRYPRVADPRRPRPHADPFIVAIAKVEGLIVITMEDPIRYREKRSNPKIPTLCDQFGVDRIFNDPQKFFRHAGWRVSTSDRGTSKG